MLRCVYVSNEWSIDSLPNCVDTNPNYLTPLDDPAMVRDTIFNERPPNTYHTVKGKKVIADPFQMVLSEIKTKIKRWENILSENSICLSGNKDHPNACLVYMLYCLANQRKFNLAYYIAKRMARVIKSDFMVLPYAMLLTHLYMHVLSIHPYPTPNIDILVDHVMVPFIEGQANRIMVDGKRPHPKTSSGSSSSSPSRTLNQEENESVDNYTFDLVVYMN
uniref:Pentatricopeptide repeat-containing protein n=1 Tax=Tanacetum cinerariifolium TaxID=118510 RepID=A0A6L2LDA7_TANCI|nr:hypothetical protein [Tanacetum cinerariifolium]